MAFPAAGRSWTGCGAGCECRGDDWDQGAAAAAAGRRPGGAGDPAGQAGRHKQVQRCIQNTTQNLQIHTLSRNAECLLGALLEGAGQGAGPVLAGRCCPMCETTFPTDCSQEAFETHVVEHFRWGSVNYCACVALWHRSYEDSETMQQYDTVPDAFWPGIAHDPETVAGAGSLF